MNHFVFSTSFLFSGTGAASSTGDAGKATSATLNGAFSIFGDSLGNYYVTESNGYRVRKIAVTTFIISTLVGTQTS